ncbi:TKL/TKL-ccin protein kinase [Amanita rubescens]|nr:TKL/TKL-ccin protein kinase [Amanita rubescens]
MQLNPDILKLNGQVTKASPDVIDCGAFSNLYKGDWNYGGRIYPVAIKVPRGFRFYSNNPEERQRAQQDLNHECNVWLRLNHQNILPFYGIDNSLDVSPAMISPLCTFGDIGKYLRLYPSADRFKILDGVASGLEYLHGEQVVHGDIKPNNILINDHHIPVLCDFGRSRIIGQTDATGFAGTFLYMAPELIADDSDDDHPQVTLASDVYAFAITGAEILNGQPAFIGSRFSVENRVLSGERPQSQGLSGKAANAWPILEACWVPEPSRRMPMNVVAPRLHQL